MRNAMIMTTMMAMTAGAYLDADGMLPALTGPKPRYYRVHLSKAERRGKSYAEFQALREERLDG